MVNLLNGTSHTYSIDSFEAVPPQISDATHQMVTAFSTIIPPGVVLMAPGLFIIPSITSGAKQVLNCTRSFLDKSVAARTAARTTQARPSVSLEDEDIVDPTQQNQ